MQYMRFTQKSIADMTTNNSFSYASKKLAFKNDGRYIFPVNLKAWRKTSDQHNCKCLVHDRGIYCNKHLSLTTLNVHLNG